jgi:hypothetical protein
VAGSVSLHDLIEGIANAIIQAQDRIERHQISNLSRYFDKDDRPVSVHLRLPNPSLQAAEGEEDVVFRVPLLALVHSNLLKIKDVEINFQVDLGDFTVAEPPATAAAPEQQSPVVVEKAWKAAEPQKALQVDMRSSVVRDRGATANIVLKVEGRDPTEGMSRLINQLLKTM